MKISEVLCQYRCHRCPDTGTMRAALGPEA